MFCKNCGKELNDTVLFCPACGHDVDPLGVSKEETTKKTPKVWDVFCKIGYTGGLVCFILSFIPFVGFFAGCLAPNFIVFSALGKQSGNLYLSQKGAKGLKFSIAATIIGIVGYFLFFIILMSLLLNR